MADVKLEVADIEGTRTELLTSGGFYETNVKRSGGYIGTIVIDDTLMTMNKTLQGTFKNDNISLTTQMDAILVHLKSGEVLTTIETKVGYIQVASSPNDDGSYNLSFYKEKVVIKQQPPLNIPNLK